MKLLLSLLIGVLATSASAQSPAHILWARGHQSDLSDPLYSPVTGTILTLNLGEWQSWPVGRVSLPLRKKISDGIGAAASMVLTKGGRELIAATSEGMVHAWDPVANTDELIVDYGFDDAIEWIDANPDGRFIAVDRVNADVHIYDRSLKKEVASWSNSRGEPSFNADGTLLLIPLDNSLALINTENWSIVRRYSNVFHPVAPVKFNPVRKGEFYVQGTSDSWLMDTSGAVLYNVDMFVSAETGDIAFSPSGKQLCLDGSTVLNLDDFHTSYISGFGGGCCFIGEDSLATADLQIASVSKRRVLGRLSSQAVFPVSFLPSESTMMAGSFWAWDVDRGQGLSRSWFPSRYGRPIGYSAHGAIAAGVGSGLGIPGNGICFWPSRVDTEIALEDIADTVKEVLTAFSPDSSVFLISLQLNGDYWHSPYGGHVLTELWNVKDLSRIAVLTTSRSRANAIVYSNDGSLISMTDEDSCYIWRASDGTRISAFWLWSKIAAPGEVMAFMPGDTTLLMRGYEMRTLAGEVLKAMPNYNRGQILRLSNGRYIGGPNGPFGYYYYEPYVREWIDSTIEFFDLEKGAVTATVRIKRTNQYSVAVNPITGEFVSGGEDLIYYASIDPGPTRSVVESRSTDPLLVETSSRVLRIHRADGVELSGQLSVYNTLGECVWTEKLLSRTEASVDNLTPSVYFVRFDASDGRHLTTSKAIIIK